MFKLPVRISETLAISGVPKSNKTGGIYKDGKLLSVDELSAIFGVSVKAAERMHRGMEINK